MRRTAIAAVGVVIAAPIILSLWRLYQAGYSNGRGASDSSWEQRWTQRDLADVTVTLHHEVAMRNEERRRQAELEQEVKNAEVELAMAHADYLDAESAAGELQSRLDEIKRQLARSEAGRMAAVADAGAAKTEAARVLAELLSESDNMAGKFAAEADANYITGSACERIYNRMTTVEH